VKRLSKKITIVELAIVIGLFAILAAVLLPALARSREAARRSSCANNLKQMGVVLKMYSNEWDGFFPPVSPITHNWIPDLDGIYPEYLTDLNILACPSNPFHDPDMFRLKRNYEHPGTPVGSYHPDCVSSLSYIYTGRSIFSDEQAVALFDAYYNVPPEVFAQNDLRLDVPVWEGSSRVKTPGQSGIPVVWDRIPLDDREFWHTPHGGNVLHMDGHVEFVRYSHYNRSNFFPITRISAETFGSVMPRLSTDCYSY